MIEINVNGMNFVKTNCDVMAFSLSLIPCEYFKTK